MTPRTDRLRAYFNFQGEPVNERHAKTRAVFEALVEIVDTLGIIDRDNDGVHQKLIDKTFGKLDKILDGE